MSYLRCLSLFVGGLMSYLPCLCLFVGGLMSYLLVCVCFLIVVSNTYCVVLFVLLRTHCFQCL
jgi:hypothetical protein